MALAVVGEGDKVADGTEQNLDTEATSGVFVLAVDCGAMVGGDELELRIKTKVRAGSNSRLAYYAVFVNAQGVPNKYSVPVPSDVEFIATLKQTAGTNRTYPWKLMRL